MMWMLTTTTMMAVIWMMMLLMILFVIVTMMLTTLKAVYTTLFRRGFRCFCVGAHAGLPDHGVPEGP